MTMYCFQHLIGVTLLPKTLPPFLWCLKKKIKFKHNNFKSIFHRPCFHKIVSTPNKLSEYVIIKHKLNSCQTSRVSFDIQIISKYPLSVTKQVLVHMLHQSIKTFNKVFNQNKLIVLMKQKKIRLHNTVCYNLV